MVGRDALRWVFGVVVGMATHAQLIALEWRPAEVVGTGQEVVATIPWSTAFPERPAVVMDDHPHPARLFARSDAVGLHLRIVVADPGFAPREGRKQLWKGDCLYLEIDALGDNPDRYGFGSDDLGVFAALSQEGPHVRVSHHGHPWRRDALLEDAAIRFEPEGQRFVYEVRLPWDLLGSAPGLSGALGLAITVAHKGPERTDNRWGERSKGRDRTRGLHLLALAAPQGSLAVIAAPPRQPFLVPGTRRHLPLAVRGEVDGILRLAHAGRSLEVELPADRLIVGHVVVDQADAVEDPVLVIGHLQGERNHSTELRFDTVEERYRELRARLARSEAKTAAGRDHLRSLRALADHLVVRAPLVAAGDPDREAAQWFTRVYRWLDRQLELVPEDGFDLATHLASARPLLLAWVSDFDGSLQFATLQLPPDYDPEARYPLVCYLHGSGPRRPVDYLMTQVDNGGQDTLWLAGDAPEVVGSAQRRCILVSPFARGSHGFEGVDQEDVWQVLELVERRYPVDPDRRYISGFSMGCSGAAAMAAERPDYWAAANLASGFHHWGFTWDETLYPNLAGVPLVLWCGGDDRRMTRYLRRLLPQWRSRGFDLAHVATPEGLGHTYPYLAFSEMLERCFALEREPIDAFEHHLVDTTGRGWRLRGRNGFTPQVKWGVDAIGWSFSVRRDGQTIHIDAVPGISRMRIDPAAFEHFAPDLDREATVVVRWGDTVVYEGALSGAIEVQRAAPGAGGGSETDSEE